MTLPRSPIINLETIVQKNVIKLQNFLVKAIDFQMNLTNESMHYKIKKE